VPGDGTAGGVFYQLEFSNVSHTTCYLMGFPAVTAVNGTTQLGLAAGQDHTFAVRKRVLTRGAAAHAVLKITRLRPVGSSSRAGPARSGMYRPVLRKQGGDAP
jgi:uncharacterized protein DUF4232